MHLSGAVILYYRAYNPDSGYFTWQDIDKMSPFNLDPGHSRNVWLEVRRELMTRIGLYRGTLKIKDDLGNRFLVPVSAEEIQ